MSKKYVDYKAEDLILDDSFLNWMLSGEDSMFWNRLLKENYNLSIEIKKAKELIFALKHLETDVPGDYNLEIRKKLVWERINNNVSTIKIKKRNLKPAILSMVALLVILIGFGVLFYLKSEILKTEIMLFEAELKEINEVQLVLADGTSLIINDSEKDISEKDGTQIKNKSDRTLIYNQAGKKLLRKEEIYNQINIPRGKRHNLVLADGTKVWLNSETSLRFPTQFVNKKRIVILEGEAYFEVAPDDTKPFIVRTASIEVNVKGTSFNVKSYKEDNLCETTLEEGLVEIIQEGNPNSVFLNPGKKATYRKDDKIINVKSVDTKLYTSWRNGQYIFDSESLESLIVTINRWYNVEVNCNDEDVLKYKFTGVISEDRSIEHIMELIRLTSKINYEFQGEKIFITK